MLKTHYVNSTSVLRLRNECDLGCATVRQQMFSIVLKRTSCEQQDLIDVSRSLQLSPVSGSCCMWRMSYSTPGTELPKEAVNNNTVENSASVYNAAALSCQIGAMTAVHMRMCACIHV